MLEEATAWLDAPAERFCPRAKRLRLSPGPAAGTKRGGGGTRGAPAECAADADSHGAQLGYFGKVTGS